MSPSPADRREEARATAAALRAKQAKQAARQRTIAVAALAGGIVVVGALVAVILSQGGTPAAAQVRPAVATGHGGIVLDEAGAVVPESAESTDVTMGNTGLTGDWPQGALDGDPVVVSVYFDPMCPYCGLFEQNDSALLDELLADGTIVLDSHPLSFQDKYSAGTRYSTRAANALWTVAEQAPERYLPFLEALLAKDTQPAEGGPGLTDDQLAQLALGAGVPQDVADTFTDETYRWWVAQATDLASQDLGSYGTPTVLLDGVALPREMDIYDPEVLRAAIEDAAS